MSVDDVRYSPLEDEKPSSSSSQQTPFAAPTAPMQTVQMQLQPVYTMLPNGQVQVTFTLPAGAVIPQQAQQALQHSYGSFQQQRPLYPYMSTHSSGSYQYPPAPHQQATYMAPNVYPMQPSSAPPLPSTPPDNLAIANVVTFVVGLFTFLPYITSVIISYIMVKRGYFQESSQKAIVLIFSTLEMVAWLFCASFSWYFRSDCYYCDEVYYGWTAIVAWVGVALICGIARVAICMKAAKHYQRARYAGMAF